MADSPVIWAQGLVKRYGGNVALAGIDLAVPAGAILGLLGPNGAGKTTTVRILTTLAVPDGGYATVAGHDVVSAATAVRRSIGVTAQDATVDELLTGRQNLVMIGRLAGLTRRQAIWSVVRSLVADGTTVLLTTQYLEEADQLADRVAVIDHGRVIAEGTARELKSRVGGAHMEVSLTRPAPGAGDLLAPFAAGPVIEDRDRDGGGVRLRAGVPAGGATGLATAVVRAFDAAGVPVDDIEVRQPSLDDVFFALTGYGSPEPDSSPAAAGPLAGAAR